MSFGALQLDEPSDEFSTLCSALIPADMGAKPTSENTGERNQCRRRHNKWTRGSDDDLISP